MRGPARQQRRVSARSLRPIPQQTLAQMEALGTTASSPTLIRTYKKEAEFEIWKMKSDGQYALLKTFPMCRWSGQLGPKLREGDHQVPEGFYTITPGQMNPNSAYYLSFNVGYPNAFDRAWDRTGGTIMVHGICSSAGCYSMTDAQIAEIYAIAREVLQRRPARNSDAVLSLQDDGREPRQASARSEHRLLEAVEERLRSFRSDQDRNSGARVRQALRFRRARRRRGFARARRARRCIATTTSNPRWRRSRRRTTRRWPRWSPRASSRFGWSTRTAGRIRFSRARSTTSALPRRCSRPPREIVLDNSGKPIPAVVKVANAAARTAPGASSPHAPAVETAKVAANSTTAATAAAADSAAGPRPSPLGLRRRRRGRRQEPGEEPVQGRRRRAAAPASRCSNPNSRFRPTCRCPRAAPPRSIRRCAWRRCPPPRARSRPRRPTDAATQ